MPWQTNLYLRRKGERLVLAVEHRAAPSGQELTLELQGGTYGFRRSRGINPGIMALFGTLWIRLMPQSPHLRGQLLRAFI